MKKVVLFLSMHPHDGGKFQYSINIADALSTLAKNNQCSLTIVVKDEAWKEYLDNPSVIRTPKYSYLENKLRRLFAKKLHLLGLWRYLGRFFDPVQRLFYSLHPDIIFYPGNDSFAYECAVPSVVPIFDLMHRYESRFPEVGEKSIVEQREYHYKNVCRYAEYILVDSKLGEKHVLESYRCNAEKIIVLPFISPQYVYESVAPGILDKYNLPDNFILYPAQFWSHKNHIAILNALCILRDMYDIHVNAVFVGSMKNAYENIKTKITQLGLETQIRILGYVSNEELVALYRTATALVFPSYFGPTNIPPLEASTLGCPVILSDIYAHREQMGDCALFFDPDKNEDLARAIKTVYENKAQTIVLIDKAKQRSNLWNPQKYVQELSRIVQSTVSHE